MVKPIMSEIRLFGGNAIPKGWMQCNGQKLPIAHNQALFGLIGTRYGGDGKTVFALPDLRGRVVVGADTADGAAYSCGRTGGQETVTLTVNEIGAHPHPWVISTAAASQPSPLGGVLAHAQLDSKDAKLYAAMPGPETTVHLDVMEPTGEGKPHPNMQPFLTLVYCIAVEGTFPSRK